MADEDLHVFIPNREKIDESINQFIDLYNSRTRKNLEHWLLDIAYWTSYAKVRNQTDFHDAIREDLRSLKVELDDDLFFFEGKCI